MRLFLLLSVMSLATAFVPLVTQPQSWTSLQATDSRREALVLLGGAMVGLVVTPNQVNAKGSTFFYDEKIEFVKEASQMPTNGKVDLNSAFVGDYKQFPGMFPHAAGKIASNGPYTSVRDIYGIHGITDNDRKLFKKYEAEFTTNPPGRSFLERINNRVST